MTKRLMIVFAGLVAILVGLTGGMTAANATVFGPPTEGSKVVLGETSIDGPAFWTNSYGVPKAILAWTGTDTSHHINLMMSNDGLHYTDKHTLSETTLWRPAVILNVSGRGSPYGTIYLAWTGTDSAHTLNLASYAMPGFQFIRKITFWGETSFTAPSVTAINDQVQVVWAGNDRAHTLNLIPFSRFGQRLAKQTFWGWGSISRPDVSFDAARGELLLDWTGSDNRIYFAHTTNTATWTMPSTSPLAEFTQYAPSMKGLPGNTMPLHWVAWNGMGEYTNHHLLVKYSESYPSWPNVSNATTFGETAISGPELGYVGVSRQVLIAWTGTDSLHHLNVAVIFVNG